MIKAVNGLLVLDKPKGMTSRDAIDRVQCWFPKRTRIGHTGTLDPLATGVLVVCVGKATRLAEYVQHMCKCYRSKWVLGARSDTDDADGDITPTQGVIPVDLAEVQTALAGFVGEIEQTPPAFSAVKVDGRRAHSLARQGKDVAIAPRPVRVDSIDILDWRWPEIDVEIKCGKGTYIRSLARDLGNRLGCGAYVKELRRTRVGPFSAESGVSLDESAELVQSKLLPPRMAVAELPTFSADAQAVEELRHGRAILALPCVLAPPGAEMAIVDEKGALIGVGAFDDRGLIRPTKIFPAE